MTRQEKTNKRDLTFSGWIRENLLWQELMFGYLDKWLREGIGEDWEYLGFHVLRFEKFGFDDGRAFLNNILTSEEKAKRFLSF